MMILNDWKNLTEEFPHITIALGTFDGIHVGHQKIISRAVAFARQNQGCSMVFTFSNHPLSVVDPKRCPPQLITQAEKARLIAGLGVDILVNIPFTAEFLRLPAAQFIEQLLQNFAPRQVVVGPNFFFGYKRGGTPEYLTQAGDRYGFGVEIHPIVHVNERIVSSTSIRKMILAGQVDKAASYLGRPPQLTGTVVHGAKRGRSLGYPTVNLDFPAELVLPADGVYAVTLETSGRAYLGIANVGNTPTFSGINRHLEVHILNFSGDLYGKTVTVGFLKHLRPQIAFTGISELTAQIAKDIQAAYEYYPALGQ